MSVVARGFLFFRADLLHGSVLGSYAASVAELSGYDSSHACSAAVVA